jgi:hypothetical protein
MNPLDPTHGTNRFFNLVHFIFINSRRNT